MLSDEALSNYLVSQKTLQIKPATDTELEQIRKLIASGKACFEYMSKEESLSVFH